jgi:DNA-binding transcriptional regulator YiaG
VFIIFFFKCPFFCAFHLLMMSNGVVAACPIQAAGFIPYTESCKILYMNKPEKPGRPKWDGKRVHGLRQHLGLTQHGLAERLGTRQQTISEWERGMYTPRGASATLLSIVAEQAKFHYEAAAPEKKSGS